MGVGTLRLVRGQEGGGARYLLVLRVVGGEGGSADWTSVM